MNAAMVSFVIGGVQKAGTSALASYLSAHPRVRLPTDKEAHVFDRPDFDPRWGATEIDGLYAGHLPGDAPGHCCGDATPIYLFHRAFIDRIARYNPAMRWIVLLRHPVERALSQFHMERARGNEDWPLWPALLLERWRLRGHHDDFSIGSPLRRHAYLSRGDYARQLDALYAAFPRDQVLLLRSEDLRADPAAVLDQVCGFLGIGPMPGPVAPRDVFVGDYPAYPRTGASWRLAHWLLRRRMARAAAHHGLRFE
ncbi:MAG TPA: sulfotransferase [Luteimonas sp.]|nr:sulfotransferase [Luteimonas sp.]